MAKVISSRAGTRVEPIDSYTFTRGTTATFKIMLKKDGIPTTVDVGTDPTAIVYQPAFLNTNNSPIPTPIATLTGSLVTGQDFEYEFVWSVPADQHPLDEYIVQYKGTVDAVALDFGNEYFTITSGAGSVSIGFPSYATTSDVRLMKANIDDYVPQALRKDLQSRNDFIESHLRFATTKLREELSLFKQRGNSENYRLFVIFYTVWSILLSARGEDGSSVSDQNLLFWRNEWERILAQEKREGVMQGVPLGRG